MSLDSRNTYVYSCLDLTTGTGSSSGATAAATVAAQTTGVRNVAKRVQATVSCSSNTVQVPLLIGLFDGGSSTGTLLASWQVTPQAATIGASGNVQNPAKLDFDDVHVAGSTARAMCLGTNAASAAGTLVSLNLITYAFPKANPTAFASAA